MKRVENGRRRRIDPPIARELKLLRAVWIAASIETQRMFLSQLPFWRPAAGKSAAAAAGADSTSTHFNAFFRDCIKTEGGSRVRSAALFDAYLAWCKDSKCEPI